MAYLRDRRAFGNIGTRKFRGARFGDPLSPRGPQYTKEGLILDYSTDVGPFTIIDQSGQDNTATLYSGRGLTMDAVGDTVTYATGYSSASRTATLWGRFNTTSPVALLGSVSGFFTFTPTATGVWEELTSTATVSGDLAWDLGLDFDIGDLRVGTEHWTHNDWSDPTADGLNGKTIVDSGPNGYHGVCTGCSGFTGEGIDPDVAGIAGYDDAQWFNGTDTGVTTTGLASAIGTQDFKVSFSLAVNSSSLGRLFQMGDAESPTANNGFFISLGSNGTLTVGVDQVFSTTSTIRNPAGGNYVVIFDRSGNAEIFEEGISIGTVDISTKASSSLLDLPLFIGARNVTATPSRLINGAIYNISIDIGNTGAADNAYTGRGATPWTDTIGTNNGTPSGTFVTVGQKRATIPQTADKNWNNLAGQMVSASDANDQIDALGNAILEPRRNTQQLNLFGDGEHSSTPDSASLDVTTTATWELWGNFYGVVDASIRLWSQYVASERSWIFLKVAGDGADEMQVILDRDGDAIWLWKMQVQGIQDKLQCLHITHDRSSWIAYLDGQITPFPAIEGAIQSTIHNSSADVIIGGAADGSAGIGSAKIYNVALTADEVLTNYNTQKSLYGL